MPTSRTRSARRGRPDPPLVSVCLIAKNEEAFIGRSIESAKPLADEVLLGDTGSTDRTVEIARQAGAKVVHVPWQDDFALAKNAVLERAHGRWIVFIDADEWFKQGHARGLRELIQAADQNPQLVGIRVYITNLQTLHEDDILDRVKTVRVFRNHPDHRYVHPIHEQIVQSLRGSVLDADVDIVHAGYIASVVQSKNKSERNLRILTQYRESLPDGDRHRTYLMMQCGREYQRLGEPGRAREQYLAAANELLATEDPQSVPYAAILFRYLCEVLMALRDFQGVLQACERFRPLVAFPQADLFFFEGAALTELGLFEQAAQRLLIAVACSEGADHVQEYGSTHRAVVAYLGAAQCLRATGQAIAALAVAARGLDRFPSHPDLASEVTTCLELLPANQRQSAMAAVRATAGGAHPVGDAPAGWGTP